MAQVILFQDAYYHGAHAHVFFAEPNFHQGVSSLVVIEGNWPFMSTRIFKRQIRQFSGPVCILISVCILIFLQELKICRRCSRWMLSLLLSQMFLLTAMLYCSRMPNIMATISTYFFGITT